MEEANNKNPQNALHVAYQRLHTAGGRKHFIHIRIEGDS